MKLELMLKLNTARRNRFTIEKAAGFAHCTEEEVQEFWSKYKKPEVETTQVLKNSEPKKTSETKYEKRQPCERMNSPYARKQITEEKEQLLEDAWYSKMTVLEAAVHAHVGKNTVTRNWRKKGFMPLHNNKPRQQLPSVIVEKIYKAHDMGMSLPKAARYSGACESSVWYYWKEKGLAPHFKKNENNQKLTSDVVSKIYEGYEKGMSQTEIAEYAGVCRKTVYNYLKKGNSSENN